MNPVFWTGRLSPSMKVLTNANSTVWWMLGRHRDGEAMKARVRDGYDARFSDHVHMYDELAQEIHTGIAHEQRSSGDAATSRGKA